jgi:hypothetical protein
MSKRTKTIRLTRLPDIWRHITDNYDPQFNMLTRQLEIAEVSVSEDKLRFMLEEAPVSPALAQSLNCPSGSKVSIPLAELKSCINAKYKDLARFPITETFNALTSVVEAERFLHLGIQRLTGYRQGDICHVLIYKALLSGVARALHPGCSAPSVLTLVGSGGIGKSSSIKALALDGLYTEIEPGQVQKVDILLDINRNHISELSELDGWFKTHNDAWMKQLISRSTDKLRKPYGQASEEFNRQGIIMATANPEQFTLPYDTGILRRIWVVPITKFLDFRIIERFREKIWSAAKTAYLNQKSGGCLELTEIEKEALFRIQEQFIECPAMLDRIQIFLAKDSESIAYSSDDLWKKITNNQCAVPSNRDCKEIKQCMERLGYIQHRINFKGCRVRFWIKPEWLPLNFTIHGAEAKATSLSPVDEPPPF